MNTFLEPLLRLAAFEEMSRLAGTAGRGVSVSGCADVQKAHLMYGLGRETEKKLIVTYSEQRAREIVDAYRFFARRDERGIETEVLYFPAKDVLFYQSDVRGTALTKERLRALHALLEPGSAAVVTTYDALLGRMMVPRLLKDAVLTISAGDVLDLDQTRRKLTDMGYESAYQADTPGQFAVRGGILDIFPLIGDMPVRIELWGDEVDSVRSFSPDTQRSEENLEIAEIYPASEVVLTAAQRKAGLAAIRAEGEALIAEYRAAMKTEEAYHIKEQLDLIGSQLEDLESLESAENYLPYFAEEPGKGGKAGTDSGDGKAGAGSKGGKAGTDPGDGRAGTDGGRIAVGSLLDYFSGDKQPLICIDEPLRCLELAGQVEQEFRESMEKRRLMGYALPGQTRLLQPADAAAARLSEMRPFLLSSIHGRVPQFAPERDYYITARPVHSYNGSFELLCKDLLHYKKEKYGVVLVSSSSTRARHLANDLLDQGFAAFFSDDPDRAAAPGEILVTNGGLSRGFEYPDVRFAVLTETDIFGARRKRRKRPKHSSGKTISDFTDLNPGDYVVHENHGLGIYRGIEKIEVDHIIKDYMKIEYAGSGVLYVLATQLDAIQKYADSEAKKPKLNRLGGQEWKKTRSRVEKAVGEVAQELVELYAIRQNKEGFQFGEDTLWQREFEEMFPYEETSDQLQAIADTKADMESKKIMDRLICGDVGYGKTEIAIRAAFKAVQENKQVAFLVPTTILAQQHYNTFVQRLKDFPVTVEQLSRFRSTARQKEIAEQLRKGRIDIVIGTHRILSKDVQFKDLGLLIIDEEQRFGVTHKERIKQMKKDVDVLTLSATPIPRTLHMSLIGIRDMSVLEEPPEDRLPIQTYVMEYNEEMIREAIERELSRGGQVYYVYNRISTIGDMAAKISSLVPDAYVEFAHGRMPEQQLERVMHRFIDGEIDVLVSTTIIETGLDISNANTMIIHDADNMGLSQLYQLRGRIGRSSRTSYAFLMYRRNKMLKEVAEKRLSAIRDFSDLGSGFKIAMKDLEIRGAGNILGEAQHGHMAAVGYDLYCKMLGDAVRTAKGETPEEKFETSIDLPADAYIPVSYIPNEMQKLDIYKRIACIENEQDRDDMLDELIDRFGEPPRVVQNLLTAAMIKAEAHRCYFTEIAEKNGELKMVLYEKARLRPERIPDLLKQYRGKVRFKADPKKPAFYYRRQKGGPETIEWLKQFLTDCRELLDEDNKAD